MRDNELTLSEIESLTHAVDLASPSNRQADKPVVASVPSVRKPISSSMSPPSPAKAKQQPAANRSEDPVDSIVRSVMDSFAAGVASELVGPTRCDVGMEIESVREVSFGELILRMENPTCAQLLDVLPFESPFVLELHPSVLFPIFDRLLGGGQLPPTIVRRPLTNIECRLAGRITRLIAVQLVDAWRPVLDVDVECTKLLCNPRLLRSESPAEMMVVIRFQVKLGDCQGPIQLAVRRSSLVALRERLLARSGPCPTRMTTEPTTRELSVVVAQLRMSAEELDAIRVNDVLISDTQLDQPAVVHLNGKPEFTAKLGAFEEKKAIELHQPIRREAA